MEAFEADHLILGPHQFCLGSTAERVRLPADLRGVLYGRSSLARLGLVVHTVAGNLDPGFDGQITLELLNVGSRTLKIPAGWRVAHVSFEELDKAAAQPYGLKRNSKYQGQEGATASRIKNDMDHHEGRNVAR
jgi:dCTP deaminase